MDPLEIEKWEAMEARLMKKLRELKDTMKLGMKQALGSTMPSPTPTTSAASNGLVLPPDLTCIASAQKVFDEMPSHQETTTTGVLRVIVNQVLYPVTEEVLHQVFDLLGVVENVYVNERTDRVAALVAFRSCHEAAQAQEVRHGRCIYDGCCWLDIQLLIVPSSSTMVTPAKFSKSHLSHDAGMPTAATTPTVAENGMVHHQISAPSLPSTTSDREDNSKFTSGQAPLVGYAVEQLKLRHHKPLKFHERYCPYLRAASLLGLSQICQKMPQLDKALITALVERWMSGTHSFHLVSGEMTMVLDCLGHDPRGPSMPGKSFLHYKWLKKHFYELPKGADDQTVERHVRAYILSLLCGVLFPDGTGRMSLIYLPLIADLSRVGTYSWGSAVLAFLYRSLCSVASSNNIKNIGGSLLLLQLWSWERSHVGRPLVRSTPCTESGIPQDLPPIGFRWVGARTQSDNATRCLKQYRDELNLQRADQVKWDPYVHIESSSLPPLCTKDADLWLTQAPLINFPIIEMYLPERVMRQFGLRQCIPPPFRPTLQALHRISRRGRERENWEETHHEYIQEWEARRQRIFRETEQYDSSSYEEYLRWYSGATRRYLVPSNSDDTEAGPSSPPHDSSNLQYQAKSPMIRKAVDKLHGMVKKAKRAMASTADTTTQALVVEFLHGFQDVLHDLGEIKENNGSEVPPFGSATSPHFDSGATQHTALLLLEDVQNIIGDNQEAQHQEEGDLHTVEHATLALEPMDEENNCSNNVLSPHPSLAAEDNCDSATLAIKKCDTATPAPDSAIPQHNEDVDQAGHLENPPELEQSVEPMCAENNVSNNVLSSSPSSQALGVKCNSTEPAKENVNSATQGTDSSCPDQRMYVKLEDEDQESLAQQSMT